MPGPKCFSMTRFSVALLLVMVTPFASGIEGDKEFVLGHLAVANQLGVETSCLPNVP